MKMPGFTAEASLNRMSRQYGAETSFGKERRDQVLMQKPNSQNTAGGACTGRTSGTTVSGYYDSQGRCCTGPDYKGFPFCIDCDADKCYDRQTIKSSAFAFGNLLNSVFARF